MLSTIEAQALVQHELGNTPRARHSLFVAYLMRRLAQTFLADVHLWEVVGLCHDLDYFLTESDPTQHGLLTAQRLHHTLPLEALQAIAAHDHRTGVQTDTLLADMLKVADVLAVLDTRLGRSALRQIRAAGEAADDLLHAELGDRSYLTELLEQYASKHALSLSILLDLVLEGPAQ